MIASAPPAVAALLVRDLGVITSYTGAVSILTVMTFPSLMWKRSREATIAVSVAAAAEAAKAEKGEEEEEGTAWGGVTDVTVYRNPFGSTDAWADVVLCTSVAASVYILTELTLQGG